MSRKICTEKGCKDQSISRGLCPKHYQALRRRERDPMVGTRRRGPIRKNAELVCDTEDCKQFVYAKGLCSKHYRRQWRQAQHRSFAEKVLVLWDMYKLHDLDWRVVPEDGKLEFTTFLGEGSVVLDRRSLGRLDVALSLETSSSNGQTEAVVSKVFESWFREHSQEEVS